MVDCVIVLLKKGDIEQREEYVQLAYTVWIEESYRTLRAWIRFIGGGGIVTGSDELWNEVVICDGKQAEGTTPRGVL